MSSTNPSICIPRTSPHVDKNLIHSIFKKFGHIKQIDIVHNRHHNSKRIFIHFKYWNLHSELSKNILHRLENDEKLNIIYDFPWYWKCKKSKIKESSFKS